jgi:hypothetical protein
MLWAICGGTMLRQVAPFVTLFIALNIPGIVNAQNPDATKGLEGIDIVVEGFNKDVDLGFSPQDVDSQVLVAIKRDIPKLPVGKRFGAYIYVRITSITIPGGFASNVSVQLRRLSHIIRENQTDTGILVVATLWEKGSILSGSASTIRSRIFEEINEELTEFAANYYRENP